MATSCNPSQPAPFRLLAPMKQDGRTGAAKQRHNIGSDGHTGEAGSNKRDDKPIGTDVATSEDTMKKTEDIDIDLLADEMAPSMKSQNLDGVINAIKPNNDTSKLDVQNARKVIANLYPKPFGWRMKGEA